MTIFRTKRPAKTHESTPAPPVERPVPSAPLPPLPPPKDLPCTTSDRGTRVAARSHSDTAQKQQLNIETIIGQRVCGGSPEYLVKWRASASMRHGLDSNPCWMSADAVSAISPHSIKEYVDRVEQSREKQRKVVQAPNPEDVIRFQCQTCGLHKLQHRKTKGLICAACREEKASCQEFFSRHREQLSLVPESPRASAECLPSLQGGPSRMSQAGKKSPSRIPLPLPHDRYSSDTSRVPEIYVDLATQFVKHRSSQSRPESLVLSKYRRPPTRATNHMKHTSTNSQHSRRPSSPTLGQPRMRNLLAKAVLGTPQKTSPRFNTGFTTPTSLVEQRYVLPPGVSPIHNVPSEIPRPLVAGRVISSETNSRIQLITRDMHTQHDQRTQDTGQKSALLASAFGLDSPTIPSDLPITASDLLTRCNSVNSARSAESHCLNSPLVSPTASERLSKRSVRSSSSHGSLRSQQSHCAVDQRRSIRIAAAPSIPAPSTQQISTGPAPVSLTSPDREMPKGRSRLSSLFRTTKKRADAPTAPIVELDDSISEKRASLYGDADDERRLSHASLWSFGSMKRANKRTGPRLARVTATTEVILS